MLQTGDKSAHHTIQPKRERNNCSGKELQKQNNPTLEPMVKEGKYNLNQSRHEIEREYLQEMDEKVKCEDNNTAFDSTKLDKLTKLLEKLNEEDDDFKTPSTKQHERKDDALESLSKI